MPRAKPPGPFTPASHVERVAFPFDDEARRQLKAQLVKDLRLPTPHSAQASSRAALHRGDQQGVAEQIAERIIDMAQQQIVLLQSGREADPDAAPANASNVREAIQAHRETMQPFLKGWVDPGTAAILDWTAIDAVLARRDQELQQASRAEPDQDVKHNASLIFYGAWHIARQGGYVLPAEAALRFVGDVLSFCDIPHPDRTEHPTRFRAFVLGDNRDSEDRHVTPE